MRLASRYDQDEVVAAPTHHRGHEVVEGQARNAIVPTRFLRPEPYVLADGRESYASVAAECAIAFRDFVHDRAARPLFFHVAGRDAILLNAAPAGVGDDPSLAPLLRSLAAALPAHQCAYVVARLHFDAMPPDNTPAWERPHDPANARGAAIAANAPLATAIALLTWMPTASAMTKTTVSANLMLAASATALVLFTSADVLTSPLVIAIATATNLTPWACVGVTALLTPTPTACVTMQKWPVVPTTRLATTTLPLRRTTTLAITALAPVPTTTL